MTPVEVSLHGGTQFEKARWADGRAGHIPIGPGILVTHCESRERCVEVVTRPYSSISRYKIHVVNTRSIRRPVRKCCFLVCFCGGRHVHSMLSHPTTTAITATPVRPRNLLFTDRILHSSFP